MAANKSYAYVGLAGETAPGRTVKSGLYRLAEGETEWELKGSGLPDGGDRVCRQRRGRWLAAALG